MSRPLISRTLALGGALSCACLAVANLHGAGSPESGAPAAESVAPVPGSAAESIAGEVRGVFESCRKAVVKIEAVDRHGKLAGTGFFIDPNGTLYTSYTVGGESHDIVVIEGERRFAAQRIVADPRSGIAILKVDADTAFLLPGSSHGLQLASPVITIGYPMDLPSTPGFGTIGGFDLKYLGRFFATTHIRANIPVQRGEGGAPLLNMHGEVIGILIASVDNGSASFALPIAAAEKVRRDFMRFGEIRPGWMGVNMVNTEAAAAGSRARVERTVEAGPAERAGVEKGDVFLQIGERRIASIEDVLDASFFMTAEDEITVKILRGDAQLLLKLQPSEYPGAEHASRTPAPELHIPVLGTQGQPTREPLDR